MAFDLGVLVDLARYPIDDPVAVAPVVAGAHAEFVERGVAVLPGFLHAAGVEMVVAESVALAPLAHHSVSSSTVFLGPPDDTAPAGSPAAHRERAALGAVAYDLFPPDAALRRLYEHDALLAFVAGVLGRAPLYRYADPFGALNLAVMGDGDELGWHFDMTDFVVSLAIQSSVGGGDFEAAPLGPDRADDAICAVVAGDRRRVETLPMAPGTLMVFAGRWSMHRVTPIEGDVARLVALLAYDTAPGTDSSDRLKLTRYGRLPAATAAAPPTTPAPTSNPLVAP